MQYAGFFALVAKIYVQTLEVLERQQAALAEGDDDDEEGDEEVEDEEDGECGQKEKIGGDENIGDCWEDEASDSEDNETSDEGGLVRLHVAS